MAQDGVLEDRVSETNGRSWGAWSNAESRGNAKCSQNTTLKSFTYLWKFFLDCYLARYQFQFFHVHKFLFESISIVNMQKKSPTSRYWFSSIATEFDQSINIFIKNLFA